MILGIDASNIRKGGGLTHLIELLRVAEPECYGFTRVIVFGGTCSLSQIADRPWLKKVVIPWLDWPPLVRLFWQHFCLGQALYKERVSLLFVPGGSYSTRFQPVVTISQNMLPFDWGALWRYGRSLAVLRHIALRWLQSRSFRRASGVIFLSDYARSHILRIVGRFSGSVVTIPHGIGRRFFRTPHPQYPLSYYSFNRPFRLLYVSIIDLYKHQVELVEAVGKLRKVGIPVTLTLVGPMNRQALPGFDNVSQLLDPKRSFIKYLGVVPHDRLHNVYHDTDMFVFASSCENLPIILLEAMAAGLPIACSNRSVMPEVLESAGVYFDPENSCEIQQVIRSFIEAPRLRAVKAQRAYRLAKRFSWEECAHRTFSFFRDIASVSTNRPEISTRL